jgi:DNA-binding GntR family transcriptional regulator
LREALQNRILSGQLIPGQRLTQIELAKEFGVAQTVVRESLLELSFGGLVRAVDNVGVFVSDLTPDVLLEAYQIREVFEGLAARLCCQRASRQDWAELTELAERHHRMAQAGRLEEMGQLDRQFHLRTIHISRHQLLARLTEGYRLLGMIVRAERDSDTVYHEHLGIVAAIQGGEADKAEALARQHVRAGRDAVQQMAAAGRFQPHWVVEPPARSDEGD